jgi:hypothetical protein
MKLNILNARLLDDIVKEHSIDYSIVDYDPNSYYANLFSIPGGNKVLYDYIKKQHKIIEMHNYQVISDKAGLKRTL